MPKWRNFDHWWVKVVAFGVVLGAMWWMVYAAIWHYRMEHLCKCAASWEYFPFVMGGLFLIFALGILARKLTQGAAAVVLPFAQLIIERFGGKKDGVTTMTVKPPAPGQPAAGTVTVTAETPTPTADDKGDKP